MIKKFLVEAAAFGSGHDYSISFDPIVGHGPRGRMYSNYTLTFWRDGRTNTQTIEMTCDGLKQLRDYYQYFLIRQFPKIKFYLYITPRG